MATKEDNPISTVTSNEGEENNSNTKEEEVDDDELEALKRRVKEMEEEDEKLRKMQEEIETTDIGGVNKEEADARSIYIGNVDYSTTPEELQQHFGSCGTINRVTILCDKWTGHPKGFAYVEFAEKDSVANALLLNESTFKGRQLKVVSKRTNVPGMAAHRGRPPRGAAQYYYRPYYAPRGRFRSRRAFFHPYS